MKKTYIAPSSELVNMNAEGFLCLSYQMSNEEINSGWSNKKELGPKNIWSEE